MKWGMLFRRRQEEMRRLHKREMRHKIASNSKS